MEFESFCVHGAMRIADEDSLQSYLATVVSSNERGIRKGRAS